MKILYVTDLHGLWHGRTFRAAEKIGVDAIVNGGDMLPRGDMQIQIKFMMDILDKYFAKCEELKMHYIGYLGNDDFAMGDTVFDSLCDKYKYVHNIAQRLCKIKKYEFIGMNLVQDYPFRLKDRCRVDDKNFIFPPQLGEAVFSVHPYEVPSWKKYATKLPSLAEELDRLPRPTNMNKAIYVIHQPPSDVELDVCMDGRKVGSKAVYKFIERNQPLLSLHGHIHESPKITGIWKNNIHNTMCVQPGRERDFSYVIINLDTMDIEYAH